MTFRIQNAPTTRHKRVRLTAAMVVTAVLYSLFVNLAGTPADAATKVVTTSTGVKTHGGITTTSSNVGWLLVCPVSHRLSDDPIVHPRMPGMAHSHDFTGNASTNANSTYASMIDPANQAVADTFNGSKVKAGTSCNVTTYKPGTAADTGAYWRPTLYVNGVPFTSKKKDQLYYRREPFTDNKVKPIPADARLIVGNSSATSVATNPDLAAGHLYWEDSDGRKTTEAPADDDDFLLNVIFPNCMKAGAVMDHSRPNGTDNGKFAYSDSHGVCPTGFPVEVVRLSEKFEFENVPSGIRELASMTSPSGRARTFTAHADFWQTWDQSAFEYLVDRCINAAISCGTNPIAPTGN